MKVSELINLLNNLDPEAGIILKVRGNSSNDGYKDSGIKVKESDSGKIVFVINE